MQEKGEYMDIRDIIQETERRPGFLGQKRQIIILLLYGTLIKAVQADDPRFEKTWQWSMLSS